MQPAEVHRCLATADVAGLLRAWAVSHPHLAVLSPPEALIALHMARVEANSIPSMLKRYSAAFLCERGYRRIDSRWVEGFPKETGIVAAAGIASRSADPRTATRIVRAMGNAYLDALAAGIDEPPVQRERMLKARARTRFRMRIA